MDPMQRQMAMSNMAKQPATVEPTQGMFGPQSNEPRVDTEDSLMREMQDLEKAKMDGRMTEPDYLKNLQTLQSRWDAISPKSYFSKEEPSNSTFGK